MIADFTSSLYLGIGHPRDALTQWGQLTTGVPAVLGEPPVARSVAASFARLTGFEAALPATSTLHIAWDLAAVIAAMDAAVLVNHSAYPTLRVAAELARLHGAPVRRFPGHEPAVLRNAIRQLGARAARRPLIVITDGFCPMCRRATPIAGFAGVAAETGGFVVVDDTQALGILGAGPTIAQPYGRGGAGTLAWTAGSPDHVVLAASLAKGFGAPMAMIAASRDLIERFAGSSNARTHCSPPSIAALHAAAHALRINGDDGDRRRARLVAVVRAFRARMRDAGARLAPGLFPVQILRVAPGTDVVRLGEHLAHGGVRAVVTSSADTSGFDSAHLVFVLTARHSIDDIRRAAAAVQSAMRSSAPLRQRDWTCTAGNRTA